MFPRNHKTSTKQGESTVKLLKPSLLASLLAFSTSALATHIPDYSEVIAYDGTGVGASGEIGWTNPVDGYDWYCFDVVSGNQVTVNATRNSGDLFLNLGYMPGIADSGGVYGDMTLVAATGNSTTADTQLVFTPDFTGSVTLYVSTWLGENGGSYTVDWSEGGSATPGGCVNAPAKPAMPVPTLSQLGLFFMISLFAGLGWVGSRRFM